MTEEAFQKHIIMWGVESAAPQFGTTIPILKGWMRGDSALPDHVWQAWVAWSSQPPEQRTPILGAAVNPNVPAPGAAQLPDDHPALMKQSPLASKILADPAVAARIKAETTPQSQLAGIVTENLTPGGRVQPETRTTVLEFTDEIPVKTPKPNGQTIKGSIAFCCPTDRDFPPVTFECFSVLIRNHQMPLVLKSETLLVRGRNVIAERFLRTKAEWSFWADSDMILPMGNGEWFQDKSKISNLRPEQYAFDAVKRLMGHHQDFVGGVYAARTEGSQLVIQPDLEPRNQNDRTLADLIRKNQAYGIKEVGWLGFGCVLVHRRVFEAVSRTDPEIRSGKGSFFDTIGAKGEDIRFCERAIVAGFRPKLDVELVCGHLGRKCFIPEQTGPAPVPKIT